MDSCSGRRVANGELNISKAPPCGKSCFSDTRNILRRCLKTVITTRVGAEGILYDEEVNIIIAENKAKMVEAIRSLNENPETAVRIGQAARKLVEETYDNRKIIARLLMFYEQIKPGSKISFL